MKNKTLDIVNRLGVKEFIEEEHDSIFASYNILKEEFIYIEPLQGEHTNAEVFENAQRIIENETVDFRVLMYTFKSNGQYYLLEVGKSLSRIELLQDYFRKLTFFVLIIVILITIGADVMFTRYLLRPMQLIRDKLKRTNHPESFDFTTTETTTVDFRHLDESINEMMHKINAAFGHERQFIANVSHELLTPISIMKNKLENSLADEKIPDDVAMRIIEITNTLNRLIKIVNALLLISRIDNRQFLREDDLQLKDLVNEVVAEIEDRAIEKNVTIKSTIQNEIILQKVNKYLLFTMLYNLVNNAIKYNVENGSIIIEASTNNAKIELYVKDTGEGIAYENLDTLFEPFKKIKKDKLGSHGLGLPIVKTIADFHGITLNVVSKVGEGTTFELIFS